MNNENAVTITQPFCKTDSAPLFSVNAGVPIDEALEQAADLMAYVESLAAADTMPDKAQEAAVIQHLSEMAKALIQASRGGAAPGEEGFV